jgi:hypothetical protein
MFILDILIEIVGYTTARLLLPLVSFGKVYVEPVKSNKRGFNALGFRLDENKKIEVEATMAGWVGFLFWIAVTILIIYFVRIADHRNLQVNASMSQDQISDERGVSASDSYEDFRPAAGRFAPRTYARLDC